MTEHDETRRLGGEFEAVESLLAEMTEADIDMVDPPPEVWDGIASEVSAEDTAEEAGEDVEAQIVTLDRRRRFSSTSVILAAAAAVILVVAGAVFLSNGDDGPDVVATAELTFDPENFDQLGADASATVDLVDDSGTLVIDVENATLPDPSDEAADLELWLIEPDAEGNPAALVSLGRVDPDDPGSFEVPDDYDPDDFFVVDVSVEPRDGDPNHSGRSILRGPLTSV